jgi:phospholipid/cholesterol/gamma-HCH transport system permease protein
MSSGSPTNAYGLDVRDSGRALEVSLHGHWRLGDTPDIHELHPRIESARSLLLQVAEGTEWDSSLPAFVLALVQRARHHSLPLDLKAPQRLQDIIELADRDRAKPESSDGDGSRRREWFPSLQFTGELIQGLSRLTQRRGRPRQADILSIARDCSSASLPIVLLVNLLVGGILAFIGAVQLQRFGAEIFVADLVGIATAREMAALITAVVLAGRLGAAFAAQLATMQGNEEIDALRTCGVDPVRYLALPRVLALTLAMPFLYVCACAVGLLGGMAVAVLLLDIPYAAYIVQTREAVDFVQLGIGMSKSIAFAAFIAGAGCYYGLRAGRTAAAVGRAATQAVVTGIVGIIVIDAGFAVLTNALGI